MANQKLLLDTNIILDYLGKRGDDYEQTRLLMICGKVGEFSLWIASSQVTDIVYVLSSGGNKKKIPETLEKLRALRSFVNVCTVSDADIDSMLATAWSDPEDALLINIALKMNADAIITRDADFPVTDMIRVHSCPEFFEWLKKERNLCYDEIEY